jgi:hypothetical protein
LGEGLDIIVSDDQIDFVMLHVQPRGEEGFRHLRCLEEPENPLLFYDGLWRSKNSDGDWDVPRLEEPFELGVLIVALEASVADQLS